MNNINTTPFGMSLEQFENLSHAIKLQDLTFNTYKMVLDYLEAAPGRGELSPKGKEEFPENFAHGVFNLKDMAKQITSLSKDGYLTTRKLKGMFTNVASLQNALSYFAIQAAGEIAFEVLIPTIIWAKSQSKEKAVQKAIADVLLMATEESERLQKELMKNYPGVYISEEDAWMELAKRNPATITLLTMHLDQAVKYLYELGPYKMKELGYGKLEDYRRNYLNMEKINNYKTITAAFKTISLEDKHDYPLSRKSVIEDSNSPLSGLDTVPLIPYLKKPSDMDNYIIGGKKKYHSGGFVGGGSGAGSEVMAVLQEGEFVVPLDTINNFLSLVNTAKESNAALSQVKSSISAAKEQTKRISDTKNSPSIKEAFEYSEKVTKNMDIASAGAKMAAGVLTGLPGLDALNHLTKNISNPDSAANAKSLSDQLRTISGDARQIGYAFMDIDENIGRAVQSTGDLGYGISNVVDAFSAENFNLGSLGQGMQGIASGIGGIFGFEAGSDGAEVMNGISSAGSALASLATGDIGGAMCHI